MGLRILVATTLTVLLSGFAAAEMPAWQLKGPFTAVKRYHDGSYEEFSGSPSSRSATRIFKDADHTLLGTAIYRLDKEGRPLQSDTFDATGKRIGKSRFRHNPAAGTVTEDRIFPEPAPAGKKAQEPR